MDIRCRIEEIICTDKKGRSRFTARDQATGWLVVSEGYLPLSDTGAGIVLKGASGPDAEGNVRCASIRPLACTEAEAIGVLSCADGISDKAARAVIAELGTDVHGYLERMGWEELIVRLREIPGIGPSKAAAIAEMLAEQAYRAGDIAWLAGKGFPYLNAVRIVKQHGSRTREAMLADPYGPMYSGLADFKACEALAAEAGMDAWDFGRARAVEKQVLDRAAADGDTRIPMQRFIRQCSDLSVWDGGTAIPDEVLSVVAYDMGRCYRGADGTEYACLKKNRRAEEAIAAGLKRLMLSACGPGAPSDEEIDAIGAECGVRYNAQQREAFRLFGKGGVAVLTGCPGTGKTTVISGLIRWYERMRPDSGVLLTAPTGRAASRAGEASGREGLTMHKALKKTPAGDWDQRDADLDCGFIVADEMSMCDTELFASFLGAVRSGTVLLLAGDPDQLPSVGAGQVFRDIAESGKVPVYRLTELVRQEEGSGIVMNARAALAGEEIREYPDFKIIRPSGGADATAAAVREAELSPSLPLVLSPVKEGPGGVNELNLAMQERFAKKGRPVWAGGTRYYIGDPVIMTHNNYRYGFYNGEAGTLAWADAGSLTVRLPGRDVTIDMADAGEMALAYALTVHRSQGTEADSVIIVLPEGAGHMASRELLNTAFTRAKKRAAAVIPGRGGAFRAGMRQARRECGLAELLAEL